MEDVLREVPCCSPENGFILMHVTLTGVTVTQSKVVVCVLLDVEL